MDLRKEVEDIKEKAQDLEEDVNSRHSLAYEIVLDYKRTNRGLIVANVLLLVALILAIIF